MKWSPKEVRKLRDARTDGVSIAIIADMLGRTELSVLMKTMALELPTPKTL